MLKETIARLPVSRRCCMSSAGRICRAIVGILRLALLYKVVMGHVGIQPEHVGLVAADDRTRAKHRFKFRAVGFQHKHSATLLRFEP